MRHFLIVLMLFSGNVFSDCPESGKLDEFLLVGMDTEETSKFLKEISSVILDAKIFKIRFVKNKMVKVYADGPGHVRKGRGYIYCFVLEGNKWILSSKEYWSS